MNKRFRGCIAVLLGALSILLASCGGGGNGASTPVPSGSVEIPLQVITGSGGAVSVLVPVSINGQGPFRFALDTGADVSLVDQSLAEQLGLPIAGKPEAIGGVSGVAEANLVKVAQWDAGGVKLPSETVASLTLPQERPGMGLQGLLGADMLSTFGTVTIDFKGQKLILPASP